MTFEADRELFLSSVHRKLIELAKARALPAISRASSTLARAIEAKSTAEFADLTIPHYWAIYVHDGRGPVRPVRRSWLVWFTNPRDDPRLRGGYPVRESDIIRLTRDEFQQGLEENRARAAAGLPPYMIVTKYSGPTAPNRFFEDLIILDRAGTVVLDEFQRFVDEQVTGEADTARARL